VQQGLSSNEAAKLLIKYGNNELPSAPKKNLLVRFLMQLNDFMIYTLIVAAFISFCVSYMNGTPDYVEPAIILIIIIVNGIIGMIQEAKAEHSINALKSITAPMALVCRDNIWSKIPASKLVPGDIIKLETGDIVPADAKLITSNNLMTDEASLTGESVPVNKSASSTNDTKHDNMVYSGCPVCYGNGEGLVTATGMSTKLGQVAGMLISENTPDTPLQKRLAKTGKILSIISLIICIIIFFMGIAKHMAITDIFMTSVSLAVAAIPEGLPAIVTIMLSIGVTRMASRNAIIRKLPAVETLGATTIICSDKTGTLTMNKMKVNNVYCYNGLCNGSLSEKILTLGAMCNNSIFQNDTIVGEPTENALLEAATHVTNINMINSICPRIQEYPFDSAKKLMTTVHRCKTGIKTVSKGAPDILIPLCSHYIDDKDRIQSMSANDKTKLLELNTSLAYAGLRVIAVGYREDMNISSYNKVPRNFVEKNIIFAGLITLLDPPRPEAKDAIQECHTAGIRTIMITGDHAATATRIASNLGITDNCDKTDAITGSMLDQMSDAELNKKINHCNIFARVTPEHKLRIVKALQHNGEVVAMTGDGLNDAPALKAADIGCSMGITGTDVARNASDMVLEDDNFATITHAAKEGRNIYDNIRKAIHFLISCNIGEIMTIFMSILLGFTAPLYPVQLLWINLVTDSLPALSLGFEPADKNIMKRPPISPKSGMFSDGLGVRIILEGILIGCISLVAYALGLRLNPATANTMCFAVLGLSQIAHSFNTRNENSLLTIGFFGNPRLVISAVICIMLQLFVICIPVLNGIFNTVPLATHEWSIVILLSLLPVPVVELQKKIQTFN